MIAQPIPCLRPCRHLECSAARLKAMAMPAAQVAHVAIGERAAVRAAGVRVGKVAPKPAPVSDAVKVESRTPVTHAERQRRWRKKNADKHAAQQRAARARRKATAQTSEVASR